MKQFRFVLGSEGELRTVCDRNERPKRHNVIDILEDFDDKLKSAQQPTTPLAITN